MSGMTETPAGSAAKGESPFERFDDRDVVDLITEYPLAWVLPYTGAATAASLLPLLVETDAHGRPSALVGHMARRNPLMAALIADPRALILFTGPQAYLSPGLVSDRRWAPTWNYAQIRIEAQVDFDGVTSDEALAMIVDAMEHDRDHPWTIADMGPRYDRMRQAIIGFRARIDGLQGRFKLGQDEAADTLQEILSSHSDAALVRWMRRFNTRDAK